jgi:predicted alpha/beta-hydrolase family hydrolase
MLAAEESNVADALLLLSYPLHAPSRPDQQRVQHFPEIKVPCLFVQGTRDPFATVEEMQAALKLIRAPLKLVPIDGVGHDLGFKGKARNSELPERVIKEFRGLVGL